MENKNQQQGENNPRKKFMEEFMKVLDAMERDLKRFQAEMEAVKKSTRVMEGKNFKTTINLN